MASVCSPRPGTRPLTTGHPWARAGGGDRLGWAGLAFEFGAGPGQGGGTVAGGVRRERGGQVAEGGVRQERGGQRADVTEAGRVHGRGDHRLAVAVTGRALVPAQQGRPAGQALGDLPVRTGGSRRGGQHGVAPYGGGRDLLGGEPGRDVDNPA